MQGMRQDLRMKQELQLQPQQILRSELTQLPLLELEMRVNAELEENPFLEENDETNDEVNKDDAEPIKASSEDSENNSEEPDTEKREVDWEDFLNDADHWEYRPKKSVQSDDLPDMPQPDVLTLIDHLYEQLHLNAFTPEQVEIGEEIIGNVNRDGYLEVELEEIAISIDVDLELVRAVHHRLMNFEPYGIAARDLRECLLVQIRHLEPPVPNTERIIDEYWQDFINKRYEILAGRTQISLKEVKETFATVVKLNPKPGEGYFNEKQNYIIPDMVVTQLADEDEFVVYLNDGDIPNFRINPKYRQMYLSKKNTEKKVKDFLSRKLESARWFINAIHQRRTTMIHTMRAIVERQQNFFELGRSHLKPMILADIADDIGMDISTISRVTNGKYVQTDWGVFELKYFFSEKMTTEDGTVVSNRVIKQRLLEIINGENKKKPFSDQVLTQMLNDLGFQIKRRTVTKYREQLRLPVKRLRREI